MLSGTPDAPKQVWSALAPWVQALATNASTRWLPVLVLNIPCECLQRDPETGIGRRCTLPSIAACGVCRRPTCLNHSLVNVAGDAICYACAVDAIRASQGAAPAGAPPGPPPRGAPPVEPPPSDPRSDPRPADEIPIDVRFARARKVLRVKQRATWAEIEVSYKALLRKHHPDRNPQDRAGAEARFKAVRAAYDLLKQAYPESNS